MDGERDLHAFRIGARFRGDDNLPLADDLDVECIIRSRGRLAEKHWGQGEPAD